MTEISLHILDIALNSTAAQSSYVTINIKVDTKADTLSFVITDDGKGIDSDALKTIKDPFSTTRKTRKTGMGIPLLDFACTSTGGKLDISSTLGKGTTVKAVFGLTHIDRMPLGDLGQTFTTLIANSVSTRFYLGFEADGQSFCVDTEEVKEILNGESILASEVTAFLRDMVNKNVLEICGKQI